MYPAVFLVLPIAFSPDSRLTDEHYSFSMERSASETKVSWRVVNQSRIITGTSTIRWRTVHLCSFLQVTTENINCMRVSRRIVICSVIAIYFVPVFEFTTYIQLLWSKWHLIVLLNTYRECFSIVVLQYVQLCSYRMYVALFLILWKV